MTLLESGFPYRAISRLVAADRRARDPAYQAHRWWARRPPAILRGTLLAAALPGTTTQDEFLAAYASPEAHLNGMAVTDMFLGGGTTLVEAARLGANTYGSDVDPLAVLINEHQLNPPEASDVTEAGARLLDHLRAVTLDWTAPEPSPGHAAWAPLHFFSIAYVTCPACEQPGALYRSLTLARSIGRRGAVVRDVEVVAFCPDCFALHNLGKEATTLTCCGHTRALSSATFHGARYECGSCMTRSTHETLQTARAPRILLAVEETSPTRDIKRRIRPPTTSEAEDFNSAWTADDGRTKALDVALVASKSDSRPRSYGIDTIGRLHTGRQIAYLTEAFAWVDAADLPAGVERALRLAISTTITCNNRLCGYATDYGRLAPLFSVRAFSLPWLTVELNPLNPSGGRGTLAAALTRVANSCDSPVRRNVIDQSGNIAKRSMDLPRGGSQHLVLTHDATSDSCAIFPELADICITDPPYYDFIPYDTLSQVFRGWLGQTPMQGAPLLPDATNPVETFGSRLGTAFTSALGHCKPDALLAFTYKGNDDSWDAVGIALDKAKLVVTALWPVLADPHMGHHTNAGNCEYDLLVVTRPLPYSCPAEAPADPHTLIEMLREDRPVSAADVTNINSAFRMAKKRWGELPESKALSL